MQNFFLLLGMARSGTTLAQRLLVESGAIWIPRETHFWTDNPHLSPDQRLTTYDIQRALFNLDARDWFGSPEIRTNFALLQEDIRAWDFFTKVVLSSASDEFAAYGEKTPSHTRLINKLHSAQPNVRSIVLVRDPRAVFLSHLGVGWGVHDHDDFVSRWRIAYEEVLLAHETLGPEKVMIVRLEDLVQDTKSFVSSSLKFLSIPLSGESRIIENIENLISFNEPWKVPAFGEVNSNVDRRHQIRLDQFERKKIERGLSELMIHFGYETSDRFANRPPLANVNEE